MISLFIGQQPMFSGKLREKFGKALNVCQRALENVEVIAQFNCQKKHYMQWVSQILSGHDLYIVGVSTSQINMLLAPAVLQRIPG